LFIAFSRLVHADSSATVTSPDGVNLRSGPDTSFQILAVLPFGAVVTITGEAKPDNWLPVTYNGTSGFAKGDYLSMNRTSAGAPPSPTDTPSPAASTPPAVPAVPPASDTQPATVLPPDGLHLRGGPATTYAPLLTIPGGARIQVVGKATADGWYSVSFNGTLGWVDGKYLSIGGSVNVAASAPGATPTPTASRTPVPGAATTAATTPATPASRFMWPVQSRRISTVFSAAHPGIDIDEFPNGGNPVSATAAGTVTFAGGSACCSYGLYVIVKHTDGYTSLYGHLSSISVSEGQEVTQGQLLGKSGSTGRSTGAHLHFEVRKDGVAVDPLALLPGSYTIE
jgi:murein DD-endopeptidase MepM/ murein hydrolase activator NlpD